MTVSDQLRGQSSSPRAAMRLFMTALMVGGFWLHLTATKSVVAMTPDWVPFPHTVALATGWFELTAGIALLFPRTRKVAGVLLALYLVAVWPANMKHAFEGLVLPPIPDTWWYHGPRLALQPVLIWWALYGAEVIDWPWRR